MRKQLRFGGPAAPATWFLFLYFSSFALAQLPSSAVPLLIWMLFFLTSPGKGLWRGRRALRLLERGQLAQGRLVHDRSTPAFVQTRRVHELTIDFADHLGRSHRLVVSTPNHERLRAEARWQVLYDPTDPRKAVLVDDLAGRTHIEADGTILYDADPA